MKINTNVKAGLDQLRGMGTLNSNNNEALVCDKKKVFKVKTGVSWLIPVAALAIIAASWSLAKAQDNRLQQRAYTHSVGFTIGQRLRGGVVNPTTTPISARIRFLDTRGAVVHDSGVQVVRPGGTLIADVFNPSEGLNAPGPINLTRVQLHGEADFDWFPTYDPTAPDFDENTKLFPFAVEVIDNATGRTMFISESSASTTPVDPSQYER